MRVEQGHAMKQCFDINCSQCVELGAQRSYILAVLSVLT